MRRLLLIVSLLLFTTACLVDQPNLTEQSVLDETESEQEVIEEVVKSNPIITVQNSSLKTVWNKPIDLLEGVLARDYLGNAIQVSVIGDYDFNRIDTFQLEYMAIDLNGAFSTTPFVLIVGEPPIVCHPDNINGIVADNPYLPCDHVFEENLEYFKNKAVAEFEPTKEGWDLCELEGQKYDSTIYVTDCFALLDNVRNTAKVGLWVGKISN